MTNMKIQGRVAQILNARELVINIGSEHGVTTGMQFSVLAESPMEIKDPVTGETLDYIDREKVRVQASEVRAKVTICKTFRVTKAASGTYSSIGMIGALGLFDRPKETVETLRTKDSSLPPPLKPEESYVKINDRVLQIDDSK